MQALPPRQTGVSVPAKAPLGLQQGMLILPQTVHLVSPLNKSRDPEGRSPSSPWLEPAQSMPSISSPSNQRENTLEDPSHKWVINLSSNPLTQAQRSSLANGPNYAIAPRHPLT